MKEEIQQNLNNTLDFFKQKKVMTIICIALFLFLLIGSSWVRLQNLPLLKDVTTDKYIPMALDPFYFLRVAETMLEGPLPEIDTMRYPALGVKYFREILPLVVVSIYNVSHIFDGDITIQFINVISPVIFFILSLIVFFFLIFVLTKSKSIALISCIFLAIIPSYLHRTMAGFSDHEAIGMFALFLTLLCFTMFLNFLDKKDTVTMKKNILWGLVIGFLTAFTFACWGGISKFVFMIIPLCMIIFWLINDLDKTFYFKVLIFYLVWLGSTVVFGMMYGFSLYAILDSALLPVSGLINGAVLVFLIVDYVLISQAKKLKKYRLLYSILISIIAATILLFFCGINIFTLIPNVIQSFLHPFGAERVGLTVAENLQPYLTTWINKIGVIFFWIFYVGLIIVGIEFSKGIEKNKNRILFSVFWTIMISGILFSRISATSLLNGTNFISQFVYFGSLLLFASYCAWLYFNDKIKIKNTLILIVSWTFVMLIAGRGAIRLFFVITPLVCFITGYSIVKLFSYAKKGKDNVLRLVLYTVAILMVVGLIFSSIAFTQSMIQQSKYMSPSANVQWQNTMSWIRDNTEERSIFISWWDYGYWIQYLGKRPTITDGGHTNSFWDHLIGRYLLTTPKPKTALCLMKTHNVSYLLLDSTDIGKYPAYSKIGSDDTGEDRYTSIPIMLSDQRQIIETADGITFVYTGVFGIDEDIIYNEGDNEIFLPKQQTAVIGIILGMNNNSIVQPEGIFFYNDKQIKIPLRYIYIDDRLVDFENGLNVVLRVFPRITQSGQQIKLDKLGALMYLSSKVSNSLFAQLYLLNDTFENYPTLTLAHSESDLIVSDMNSQGANLGELIFFNNVRGPIKIWKVNYPENILAKEEFLQTKGEYAEFDELRFIK